MPFADKVVEKLWEEQRSIGLKTDKTIVIKNQILAKGDPVPLSRNSATCLWEKFPLVTKKNVFPLIKKKYISADRGRRNKTEELAGRGWLPHDHAEDSRGTFVIPR